MIKNKLETLNGSKFAAFKLNSLIDLPTVLGMVAVSETAHRGGWGGPNDWSYTKNNGAWDNCITDAVTRDNPCGDTAKSDKGNVCF